MDRRFRYILPKVSASDAATNNKSNETSCSPDGKRELESEEEHEKGWSDMTETEGSESEDDSKLVIDVSTRVTSKLASKDLDSSRVRSLEETMKFLEGNRALAEEMSVDCGESGDEDSDEEIVVSSSGAPDKYGFLTEIYVPKMRGFEELSDRCILDSVSVNLTLDQVIRSSMEQFNHVMRFTELTDTQREVTKYVRRRARNRVSARKSRMKKISDIVRLSSEINVIRQKKSSLRQERVVMEKLMISWKTRVNTLQEYIIKFLKDHGEDDKITLEYNDGKIAVTAKKLDEKKNSNESLDLNIKCENE